MQEMFHNELSIIRSLKEHHHIVRVFATYTVKETGALAMLLSPVADGGDLDKYLERYSAYRRNPSGRTTKIADMEVVLRQAFGCLASGLEFIHRSRIRHKDIKAHNILIHGGRVIYTDFGLSFDSNMVENSTTEGYTEMTRKYAAPEVIAGKPRNSSSDVYSLGCVFIEIFAALTSTIHYNEVHVFSDGMDDIHKQLHSQPETPVYHHVVSVAILWMTLLDPGQRWTAKKTCDEFTVRAQLRCESCSRLRIKKVLMPPRIVTEARHPEQPGEDAAPLSVALACPLQETLVDASAPRYSPWIWDAPSANYYLNLLAADGKTILRTIWADRQGSEQGLGTKEEHGDDEGKGSKNNQSRASDINESSPSIMLGRIRVPSQVVRLHRRYNTPGKVWQARSQNKPIADTFNSHTTEQRRPYHEEQIRPFHVITMSPTHPPQTKI